MQQYLDLLKKIKDTGKRKANRTGIDTLSISGAMFEHEVGDTLTMITTKRVGPLNVAKELDFFIQGRSDKSWLKDVGCHIWDEWANPKKAPYGNDDASKARMAEENDLGRIYGVQWRNWRGVNIDEFGNLQLKVVDQLAQALATLRKDPLSRRIIVSAWNPVDLDEMALPPCHYGFQLLSDGETLDLLWNQRSVDTPLGLPYNITSYSLLLSLIASTVGQRPGKLIGFLSDVHIYVNQMEGVEEQLSRTPKEQPILCLPPSTDVLSWGYKQFKVEGYNPHPKIDFPIAV